MLPKGSVVARIYDCGSALVGYKAAINIFSRIKIIFSNVLTSTSDSCGDGLQSTANIQKIEQALSRLVD